MITEEECVAKALEFIELYHEQKGVKVFEDICMLNLNGMLEAGLIKSYNLEDITVNQ